MKTDIIKPDEINIHCRLFGKKFYTSKLKQESFRAVMKNAVDPTPSVLNNVSEDSLYIKYYGNVYFFPPNSLPKDYEAIDWMLHFIMDHKKQFELEGCTGGYIQITWFGYQGSMAFGAEQLKLLHQTGLDLSIDYAYYT